MADGGAGAVAGVDAGFLGQGDEVLSQAVEQCAAGTAGQVPAADAAAEECVAADEHAPAGMIEDDAARRMARQVKEPELLARADEIRGALVGNGKVFHRGRRPRRCVDAKHGDVGCIEHHGSIGRMDVDGALVIFLNECGIPHVVEVAVGEDERDRLDAEARQFARHAFGCVEADGALSAFQHVTVGCQVASSEDVRGDHSGWTLSGGEMFDSTVGAAGAAPIADVSWAVRFSARREAAAN